jgi:hypothetical protein
MLCDDVVRLVASSGPQVACKMPAVCKDWRRVCEEGGDADATFVANALVGLGVDACMRDVMAALALSRDKVKLGTYWLKRNYRGGFYNIFSRNAMLRLFRRNGGWAGLDARLRRRRARCAKRLVF